MSELYTKNKVKGLRLCNLHSLGKSVEGVGCYTPYYLTQTVAYPPLLQPGFGELYLLLVSICGVEMKALYSRCMSSYCQETPHCYRQQGVLQPAKVRESLLGNHLPLLQTCSCIYCLCNQGCLLQHSRPGSPCGQCLTLVHVHVA